MGAPHQEAETAVVQAIFEYPELQPKILAGLRSEHFSDARLGRIFACACELHSKRRMVDAIAVRDTLKDEKGDVPAWLDSLLGATGEVRERFSAPVYIQGWKQIVHDAWRIRELNQSLAAAKSTAERESAATDFLQRAVRFGGIAEISLGNHIDEFLSYQQRLWDGSQREGFTWGVAQLDHHLLIEPGKLYLVAGSKGTSKTKLAINVLDENISAGTPCLFYSLEMGAREVLRRFASRRAQINSAAILRRTLSQDNFDRVTAALEELRDSPLTLNTSSHLTRSEVVAGIAQWKGDNEVVDDAGIVVIDFLQRIASDSGRREETDAVSLRDTAYALAGTAKEHRVAVLLIAQLNKQADGRKPEIGYLEGSGGPAQAADGVILMDLLKTRNDKKKSEDGKDELDIIIAKHREGESGKTIHCMADLRVGRYYERAPGEP